MPTALIAEDEAVIALDLAAELQSFGFEMLGIARNYAQALEIAAGNLPDVAVVDVMLQGVPDGSRLARELHARGVKVLVVTGSDDQCHADDGEVLLSKPWSREDLMRALSALTAPAAA